jgi:hypothetical protein
MIGSGCCNCAFFLFLQCPASEQDCMNVDSLFPPFSTDELFLLKQQEKIKEVVGRFLVDSWDHSKKKEIDLPMD